MKKKIIGFVMVLVLCLGMVMPVSATENPILSSATIAIPRAALDGTFTLTNVYDYHFSFGGYQYVFIVRNGTLIGNGDFSDFAIFGFEGFPDDGFLYIDTPVAIPVGTENPPNLNNFPFGGGFMWFELEGGTVIEINFVNAPTNEAFAAIVDSLPGTGSPLSDLLVGDAPQQPTTPDLTTASAWAHEGITRAIELGLVPQSLQSNYTNATTRAEFTALAVALYETATGREITGRMEFNDTNDVNVQKMAYLGVVQGVGGGNFAPNNQLTREQAAVMLVRLAEAIGQPFSPSAPTFADNAQVSSWAVDAVGQMQASGIMGGTGNNNFSPSGDYTREQSIITILRLFDVLD